MSNLFVITFKTENEAEKMLTAMADWQKQKMIKIDDAAVVVRKKDGKIKIKHADNMVGKGVMGGAFIGGVVGMIFLNPVVGASAGAAAGAAIGESKDKKQVETGIDPYFIREVAENMELGMSAVFAYTQQGVLEKILPQLKQFNGKLIKSSVTWEDEQILKEAFGAQESEAKDPLAMFEHRK